MTKPPLKRCAIYTRKSHEEGLDQDFNSLDAQREACMAFITSQKHEGWQMIKTHYDDGGFTGGNMERPALKQLLTDIEAGKIDVIVVYKVDRLSRSLNDFARMVEVFDKHAVSFVSVTQQFNTTTSMGRLTLNVLLSFAQFEREVTGERIRDKIAASKKKGMWMGGPVPLGYDAVEKKLVINPVGADIVRMMFQRYLELGCVRLLQEEMVGQGGKCMARGAIYMLLSNPIYIGQIRHKEHCYPGQHEPIIGQTVWEQVQTKLESNSVNHRKGKGKTSASLLIGKLFDASGKPLSTSHAVKQGRRYRYYISRDLKTGTAEQSRHRWRLPAQETEHMVTQAIKTILDDGSAIATAMQEAGIESHQLSAILDAARVAGKQMNSATNSAELFATFIKRVELQQDGIRLTLLLASLVPANPLITITQEIPMHMKRCGIEMRLVIKPNGSSAPRTDLTLIKAMARAHEWFGQLSSGEAASISDISFREGIDKGYISHMLNLAFLAPDITEAIIAGNQPADLSVHSIIKRIKLPLEWTEQRRLLGFA